MTAVETGFVGFTLNGAEVRVRDDHPHLLAALREELDLTSAKDGCSPSGQCGCCTVMIDGKVQVSCQLPLAKVDGRTITTLEGVAAEERTRYAQAFAACGGLQCGFCIPGIVMRAKGQIDKKGADLTRDDMARHLGAHLCRCTGYTKILDAIDVVAKGKPVDVRLPAAVGDRGVKYEAEALALGDRPLHRRPPRAGHAARRPPPHRPRPRRPCGASMWTRLAPPKEWSGCFTAADVPGELRVGIIHTDWPVLIPVDGRTSYAGDVLAIVVAETRQQARDAAALVEVDYEVHRPLTDAVAALDDPEIAVWGTDSNVLSRSQYARGDVDAALAASAHVVHEVFQTQRIEHAFLEPEATLAVPGLDDDGRRHLHVYSGGQGVWDDRNQIASVLGVERDTVTVELVSNGGAFGGKEDMANQAQAALAAWLLDRPVKCVLSREESLLMHPKRHPLKMESWLGCDGEGRLTALRFRAVGDSGAYASVGMKVLERAAGHASGPYHLPAIDVESVAVRTNNPVCGAFRGFGANQAQFAMDGVPGPAGRAGRHQRVGDPQAQRHQARSRVGPRADHGRRRARRRGLPRRHPPGVRRRHRRGEGGRSRSRAEELRVSATASRRSPRPASGTCPTGPSRSATAGPRWARACTPWPSRSRRRSWRSTRAASAWSSTRPASWASVRPPGAVAR